MRPSAIPGAAAALLLAACGSEPSPTYFPLNEGLHWHYRVTAETSLGKDEWTWAVKGLGTRKVDGEKRQVRLTEDGTEYQFRVDPDGIRRVAKRSVVELDAQPDFPERVVLTTPVALGAQWQNITHPYVLKRKVSDGVNLRSAYALPMTYTIESLDDTVSVAAGVYSGCVKVVGEADLQMYIDGPRGFSAIPVVTEEWYAPGVGLVKLVRTESVESDLMAGGRLEMELVSFED